MRCCGNGYIAVINRIERATIVAVVGGAVYIFIIGVDVVDISTYLTCPFLFVIVVFFDMVLFFVSTVLLVVVAIGFFIVSMAEFDVEVFVVVGGRVAIVINFRAQLHPDRLLRY